MTETPPLVYDRNRVRLHRDRAARLFAAGKNDDFLYLEVAQRLADCLDDVKRSFPRVLNLGCRMGHLWPLVKHKAGSDIFLQTDSSRAMLNLAANTGQPTLLMDEEDLRPLTDFISEEKFDLVLAGGGLHWVNDLPGVLHQIRNVLKPDGLFLGAAFSGETLAEARVCMMETEQQVMGGVSPRFNPGFELADAAGLLQRAGFALPVADVTSLTVGHSSAYKLVQDLRAMGETNAHQQALKRFSAPSLLPAFFANMTADQDEEITSRFDLMILSGWAPDASQQQPLAPGSGKTSFMDVL